jgi:hypothetical protein
MPEESEIAARGTATQSGLESLDPIERKMKRKNASLKRLLDEGDSKSERSGVIAGAEVEDELGIFDDKPEGWKNLPGAKDFKFAGEEWNDARKEGFAIRSRRDILYARLNSDNILDSIAKLQSEVTMLRYMVAALILVAIYIASRVGG